MNTSPLVTVIEEQLKHNLLLRTQLSSVKDTLNDIATNQFFESYTPKTEWFRTTPSSIHGITHLLRVLVLGELISQKIISHYPPLDIEAVRWAAITHDTQRIDDYTDSKHGERSSQWVLENCTDLKNVNINTVSYLNKWHVPHDQFAPRMTSELKVFKDADGLDRWRINSLDPSYLRTAPAKNLTEFANWFFYTSYLLKRDYNRNCSESVIDAVKLLSQVHLSDYNQNCSESVVNAVKLLSQVQLSDTDTPISPQTSSQNQFRMFHYTTLFNWNRIQRGTHIYSKENNGELQRTLFKGLLSDRRVINYGIPHLPQEAYGGGIWGFLEEVPHNWINSSQFSHAYNRLLDHISGHNFIDIDETTIVQLEIKLTPEDNPFVLDWAHIENICANYLPIQEIHQSWQNYWNSKVPLSDYNGSYSLPEVIIQNKNIDLDRITYVSTLS